jgi:hypothetical protein
VVGGGRITMMAAVPLGQRPCNATQTQRNPLSTLLSEQLQDVGMMPLRTLMTQFIAAAAAPVYLPATPSAPSRLCVVNLGAAVDCGRLVAEGETCSITHAGCKHDELPCVVLPSAIPQVYGAAEPVVPLLGDASTSATPPST